MIHSLNAYQNLFLVLAPERSVEDLCLMVVNLLDTLRIETAGPHPNDFRREEYEKVASVDASHQPGAPRAGANAQEARLQSPWSHQLRLKKEKGKRETIEERQALPLGFQRLLTIGSQLLSSPGWVRGVLHAPPRAGKRASCAARNKGKEWRSNRRANASLAQAGYAGVCD